MTVALLRQPKTAVRTGRVFPNAFNQRRERKKREIERIKRVESALLRLTSLQARVLRLYYGLEGWRPMTFHEISETMIVRSTAAVRSLHRRAIRSIRSNPKLCQSLKQYH